jgi:hypothetical protein
MSMANSPDNAVTLLALQSIREVENAGRRQIIHAVQDDTAVQTVKGWARVATGRETCAWCLMLVSRGPVYESAQAAGLNVGEDEGQHMYAAGTDVKPLMNQWHPGCDCIVVPVYKTESWPGKAAQERALELWNAASKTAANEDDKVHPSGKDKGQTMTHNQRALNALRRSLANGDISTLDYAGLAEAA